MKTLEKDVETLEKLTSGLHYAVLGLPEVPGSGLVAKVDMVQHQCTGIQRSIAAMIGTGLVAIGTQLILHFTG